MDLWLIGLIGAIVLYAIAFAGMPLGFCMVIVAFIGYAIIDGPDIAIGKLGIHAVNSAMDYNLSCLPFFILLGEFAYISGMIESSYRAAYKWLGQLPGGLAMASVAGAALFSTVSGSSIACAAVMVKIALPDLLKHKYHPELAVGSLCAGGTLGSLIPPGMGFIIYALVTDQSIGKLFMASMIPGILLTVMYFVQIYIQCKLIPNFGPPGPRSSLKEKVVAFKDVWVMMLLFALVMGGIWFGIYTPNESATIGAVGALLFAIISRKLTRKNFYNALLESVKTTGMVFILFIGAQLFSSFVAISGFMKILSDWVISLNMSPVVLVVFLMLLYIVVGTAFDTLSMVMLTIPILLPVLQAANIDLIWFGVLMVTQMELSQISPPVGMILFTVAAMVKEEGISMGTIFRAVLPYCYTMIVFNAVLIIFPVLCSWLPSTMK